MSLNHQISVDKIAEYERLVRAHFSYSFDSALRSPESSASIASEEAVRRLSALGFDVVGIKQEGWTCEECEATLAAYLDCPRTLTEGAASNKIAINRYGTRRLNDKRQFLECGFGVEHTLKHRNPRLVSTIANYQRFLKSGVLDMVAHRNILHLVPGKRFLPETWSERAAGPSQQMTRYADAIWLPGRAFDTVRMIGHDLIRAGNIERGTVEGYNYSKGTLLDNDLAERDVLRSVVEHAHCEFCSNGFSPTRMIRDMVAAVTLDAATMPQVLFETTSRFGRIIVEQQGLKRSLRLGERRVVQTVIKPDKPSEIDSEYVQLAMAALLCAPEVRRVLIIGLGGGAMPMFLRWADPALVIDVAEIDLEVVQIAKEWFGFREDSRLRAHVADGLAFVEQPGPTYDAILLDAYAPDIIPPHLATRGFFAALMKRLSSHGVVVSNVWGPPNPHFKAMVATQHTAFAELYILRCVREENQLLIGLPWREALAHGEASSTKRYSE